MIKTLNQNYSTTRLCYNFLDDNFLEENGKIKENLKFKTNIPEFKIQNSKIIGKPEDKLETILFLPEGEGKKGEGGLRTKGYFKFSYEKKDNEWWIVEDYSLVKKVELDKKIEKNYEKLPLISIITVVFNGKKYLEETIKSVINQTYPNIEYIIIDGGSTDGTLDIIRKYEDKIDYWVSEKDRGIYDAMNKGIELANGEWINFMNAGDKFVNFHVLESIPFDQLSNYVLIYGNKIQNGRVIYPLSLEKLKVGEIHANHQSMFFNKAVLKNELSYDIRYKIYGDYELVNRIYMKFPGKIKYLNKTIADFQGGGISSVVSYQKRKDKYSILLKHYGIIGLAKGIIYRILKAIM